MGKIVTPKELAEIWNVSLATIALYKRRGMPAELTSSDRIPLYDLDKVSEWREETHYDGLPGRPVSLKDELDVAKLRKEQALADKYELELKAKKKVYILREEVHEEFLKRVSEVRGALLALPGQLAPRLAHRSERDVYDELHEAVTSILNHFARRSDVIKEE